MTPEAQATTMRAPSNSPESAGIGWKVLILKQAAQVRETKNLCYSATYWETKERPQMTNLLNH